MWETSEIVLSQNEWLNQKPKQDIDEAIKKYEQTSHLRMSWDYKRIIELLPYFENWFIPKEKRFVYEWCLKAIMDSKNITWNSWWDKWALCIIRVLWNDINSKYNQIPWFLQQIQNSDTENYKYICNKWWEWELDSSDISDIKWLFDTYCIKQENIIKAEQTSTQAEQKLNEINNKYNKQIEQAKAKLAEVDWMIKNNPQANQKLWEMMKAKDPSANVDDADARSRFIFENRDSVSQNLWWYFAWEDKVKFDNLIKWIWWNVSSESFSSRVEQNPWWSKAVAESIEQNSGKIETKNTDKISGWVKKEMAEKMLWKDEYEQKSTEYLKDLLANPDKMSADTKNIVWEKTLEQLTDEDKTNILNSQWFYDNIVEQYMSNYKKNKARELIDIRGKQWELLMAQFTNEWFAISNESLTDWKPSFDVTIPQWNWVMTLHWYIKLRYSLINQWFFLKWKIV